MPCQDRNEAPLYIWTYVLSFERTFLMTWAPRLIMPEPRPIGEEIFGLEFIVREATDYTGIAMNMISAER
jgi:hypothetical protein